MPESLRHLPSQTCDIKMTIPRDRFASHFAATFVGLLAFNGLLVLPTAAAEADAEIGRAITIVRGVGQEGAGFEKAIPAATRLRSVTADQLPRLLDGMADTNPIAENWLRGVVFDVARKVDEVPISMLSKYAMDQSNNPKGRGLAMELIQRQSSDAARELIAKCLDDPSLPLREMAVEQTIEGAKELKKEDPTASKKQYRQALIAARHPRQLSRIIDALGELGEEVKTADAFAMITEWKSLAPLEMWTALASKPSTHPKPSSFPAERSTWMRRTTARTVRFAGRMLTRPLTTERSILLAHTKKRKRLLPTCTPSSSPPKRDRRWPNSDASTPTKSGSMAGSSWPMKFIIRDR